MARFTFETSSQKEGFKKRALSLKPKVIGVIATSEGWAKPQLNGHMELLVSFAGLDELMGDQTPEVFDEVPLVFQPDAIEEVKVDEPIVSAEETKVEESDKIELTKPAPKKGGRPPKLKAEA